MSMKLDGHAFTVYVIKAESGNKLLETAHSSVLNVKQTGSFLYILLCNEYKEWKSTQVKDKFDVCQLAFVNFKININSKPVLQDVDSNLQRYLKCS